MTNLILIHKDDILAANKTILNIDNWRVIGQLPSGSLFLTTHDCKIYHVSDMTISKFHELIRMGLEMTREASFHGVELACPVCHGTGITDWVSDIVGNKRTHPPFEVVFIRDPDAPAYKASVTDDGERFTAHFSFALIPSDAQQHCTSCKGSGLFSMRKLWRLPFSEE